MRNGIVVLKQKHEVQKYKRKKVQSQTATQESKLHST